ncbi:MAG TPA: hypothetical protein ENN69_06820, partial [Spirochaetia bacterium]|nr:hypothetical protein [Spirochaetia bacterium]
MKLKSKRVLSRLFSNWHVKVIALVASIFIFIFYRVSTQQEITIPLEVTTPSGFEIAEEWPETVTIIIHGADLTEGIGKESFRAYVDLSAFTSGGRVNGSVRVERRGEAVKKSTLEFAYSPSV